MALGFPGGSMVKDVSVSEADKGSVSGSGRSLEKEMATHSSILPQEIPWTEKPGDVAKESDTNQQLNKYNIWHQEESNFIAYIQTPSFPSMIC